MDTVIIVIIITLVFSVTIGLIIINRDEIPEILVEEFNETLEERRKEIEEEKENNNQETKKSKKKQIDDDEII